MINAIITTNHIISSSSNFEIIGNELGYELNNDKDFDKIEKIAQKSGKRCCIKWYRDSDGQIGYWGPSGCRFNPYYYN